MVGPYICTPIINSQKREIVSKNTHIIARYAWQCRYTTTMTCGHDSTASSLLQLQMPAPWHQWNIKKKLEDANLANDDSQNPQSLCLGTKVDGNLSFRGSSNIATHGGFTCVRVVPLRDPHKYRHFSLPPTERKPGPPGRVPLILKKKPLDILTHQYPSTIWIS